MKDEPYGGPSLFFVESGKNGPFCGSDIDPVFVPVMEGISHSAVGYRCAHHVILTRSASEEPSPDDIRLQGRFLPSAGLSGRRKGECSVN